MCRAQDHAWHLVDFECFLPTRGTQAPTITWFEPREAELWHGSRKIIAARFGKREKLRCHHNADSVTPYVLTPRIAATIAIESCHGFPSPRSSLSTLCLLKIFDRSGISKSTLAQPLFSTPRRAPPALAGLTPLAARPLDHPACAGLFGSRLPNRTSMLHIQRLDRASLPCLRNCTVRAAGPLSRDVGLPQSVRPQRGGRKLVPDPGWTNRRARSQQRSLNPGAVQSRSYGSAINRS